jgi:hypothetical protein
MTVEDEKQPLVYPLYYYLVERDSVVGSWTFKHGETFYNPSGEPINHVEKERYFGLTKPQIATELFRINGGKSGWYLVDMRSRKYYYCGMEKDCAKALLRSLLSQ